MLIVQSPGIQLFQDGQYRFTYRSKAVFDEKGEPCMDLPGYDAVRHQFAQLHIDDPRTGTDNSAVQLAGAFNAATNGIDDAGFPFGAKHLHGHYNAAIEVFFYLSLVHLIRFRDKINHFPAKVLLTAIPNNFSVPDYQVGYWMADIPLRICGLIIHPQKMKEMSQMVKGSGTGSSTRQYPLYKLITIPQLLFWIGIFLITHFFMRGADHFLEMTPAALGKYFSLRWVLIAHITGGGGALILGPLQFWGRLRTRYVKLHRWLGVLYLLAILLSSVCALILSYTTAYDVNWAYAFSLQVWVSVWIISTVIGYWAALRKKFVLHQEWMTRSYIVTLAFIVSGLVLKFLLHIGFGTFEAISPSLFWMGWSVPLFVYQVILGMRAKK